MRILLLVVLASCGRSRTGEIPCADAVAHGVRFSDAKERADLTEMLTAQCEDENWSAETRSCLVGAKSSHEVSECARTFHPLVPPAKSEAPPSRPEIPAGRN
ncbi:MAG TPA: hypothetical protein VGC41_22340 [Kofleriaceae bacterium]